MAETKTEKIQRAVRRKYAAVSRSMVGKFQYPTGKAGAAALGYDLSLVSDLPEEIFDTFCGVGNPLSLGPSTGANVLDVGCATGLDMILVSRLVGASGQVCGIDLTQEMAAKAHANFVRVGAANANAVVAASEAIPYRDNTFDLVISNGVLNLSPEKEQSLGEVFRVLRPAGRFEFADIVLKEDLPEELRNSLDAWSD